MSIIILPENRAAWLEERKYGLGASDAGAYLGMSKWTYNDVLWEEKVGLREPEDIGDKPYVKYGHDAEPHIRALFALDHPELRVTYESPYKIIRNDEHPFIFCTPDGELEELSTGRRGGLEIKTTEIKRSSQWAEWDGRIPDQYYSQVIHQMIATGWEFVWLRAHIRWYNSEGELRSMMKEYPIERGEAMADIDYVQNAAVEFWRQVETNTRPARLLPEI